MLALTVPIALPDAPGCYPRFPGQHLPVSGRPVWLGPSAVSGSCSSGTYELALDGPKLMCRCCDDQGEGFLALLYYPAELSNFVTCAFEQHLCR